MDQGKIDTWKSREIFQNSEYANIYGKHRKYLVTNVLGNTCFLMKCIWKRLNKKARNQIRQAQKNNVTVTVTESENDFLEWWNIYSKTVDRKKFISDTFNLNKELFENHHLSRLFVAKIDNKIISGNLILLSDNGIIWKLGGADHEYFEYRPNHLLQ